MVQLTCTMALGDKNLRTTNFDWKYFMNKSQRLVKVDFESEISTHITLTSVIVICSMLDIFTEVVCVNLVE